MCPVPPVTVGLHQAIFLCVVLCFLAHEHAQDLYRSVHRKLLHFNTRIRRIISEVQQVHPDVLSLQEVDRPEEFASYLADLGYVALEESQTS